MPLIWIYELVGGQGDGEGYGQGNGQGWCCECMNFVVYVVKWTILWIMDLYEFVLLWIMYGSCFGLSYGFVLLWRHYGSYCGLVLLWWYIYLCICCKCREYRTNKQKMKINGAFAVYMHMAKDIWLPLPCAYTRQRPR